MIIIYLCRDYFKIKESSKVFGVPKTYKLYPYFKFDTSASTGWVTAPCHMQWGGGVGGKGACALSVTFLGNHNWWGNLLTSAAWFYCLCPLSVISVHTYRSMSEVLIVMSWHVNLKKKKIILFTSIVMNYNAKA